MSLRAPAPARTSPAATKAASADARDVSSVEGAPREELTWADLTPTTFARAKAERRFIVLDGAASWCHWCHVMEATTYHDPAVAQIVRERFIAVKVDIDARPDIEERYADYGWPATVIFSPDGAELGKYKGYIDPARFAVILRDVTISGAAIREGASPEIHDVAGPMTDAQLAWISKMTELELADYYDAAEGGWGKWQKAPMSGDNEWALDRAARGSSTLRAQVLFTLAKQRALIDPVWGGIYQYSAGGDWNHPHFEKLAALQAGALENYATAYRLTKDAAWLAPARSIFEFTERFMTGQDGGFYATQDADVNAHDPSKPFVDGHAYYALDDRARRSLGMPRIDMHEYGRENGLMIGACATYFEATGERAALASAERAARRILTTHATARGGISHDATSPQVNVVYLADNAAFAWGLWRLFEVTHNAEYADAARRIVAFLSADLADPAGGFFAITADPNAVGVFATRRKPFDDNVLALRLLVKIIAHGGATADDRTNREIALRTLGAIATPEQIKARGRILGDFLLALSELRALPPPRDVAPPPPPG